MRQSAPLVPSNKRLQPTGWIGAILASRSSKKAIPIYQFDTLSRRLSAGRWAAFSKASRHNHML
jgi:hypothetical protein